MSQFPRPPGDFQFLEPFFSLKSHDMGPLFLLLPRSRWPAAWPPLSHMVRERSILLQKFYLLLVYRLSFPVGSKLQEGRDPVWVAPLHLRPAAWKGAVKQQRTEGVTFANGRHSRMRGHGFVFWQRKKVGSLRSHYLQGRKLVKELGWRRNLHKG